MDDIINIGISACLLGYPVRYDGGHSRDPFLADTLGRYVRYVPVCPETESGMPVPREALRLEGDPLTPRLITHKTRIDYTDAMKKWAGQRLDELEKEDLCGFIFKKNSPSSGLFRVRIYDEKGRPARIGAGIFARAFTERFPLLPVEEDGRLNDPELRENFIERIFTMKRWRETIAKGRSMGAIVDFHTRNKLLILSHSTAHYRAMGKLAASGKGPPIATLYHEYERLLMEALSLKSTIKKNVNVLQHMMGYFKTELSADEKKELLEIFDQYKNGMVPLIVPVTLMNHYVRKYDNPYLTQQTYLNPHPIDLKLRNHA
jgi:uncharacterized protein YbgA (DUF1722 family)/uncharacterized protein YbbK (DUF523 family)